MSKWVKDLLHELSDGKEIMTTKRTNSKHIHTNKDGVRYSAISGQRALALIDNLRKLPLPRLEIKWDKPEILQLIEERRKTHPDKFLD